MLVSVLDSALPLSDVEALHICITVWRADLTYQHRH